MAIDFDYSKLRGKIRECYGAEIKFAKALGVSANTLSAKLNCKVAFTSDEMVNACNLLGISMDDATEYFFTPLAK